MLPAADVGRGLLGFCVVAETHECGGAAADHARRVLAQVPEQQRDRRPAQVARFRETLEVAPGDLVGPGDEHRGRFLRGTRYLDGQPVRGQRGISTSRPPFAARRPG